MGMILNKAMLLKQQSEGDAKQVKDVCDTVNRLLAKAIGFPITVSSTILGKTTSVHVKVIDELRKAGWSCELKYDQQDGDYYEVS